MSFIRRTVRRLGPLIVGAALVSVSPPTLRAETFIWLDEQGTTHFSNDLEETETRQGGLPLTRLSFDAYRNVVATLPSGQEVRAHRWSLMNQFTWLDWYDREADHPIRARAPLEFRDKRLLIAWPPGDGSDGFLVFERIED